MEFVIKEENGLLTGVISGRLDTVSSEQFAKDMQPMVENADKALVLDCAALEYISSSGLRHFLALRKQVDAKGGSLVVKNMNAEIRQVFNITGFSKLFTIE